MRLPWVPIHSNGLGEIQIFGASCSAVRKREVETGSRGGEGEGGGGTGTYKWHSQRAKENASDLQQVAGEVTRDESGGKYEGEKPGQDPSHGSTLCKLRCVVVVAPAPPLRAPNPGMRVQPSEDRKQSRVEVRGTAPQSSSFAVHRRS